MTQPDDTIPYGFCHCGCGRKTNLAPFTYQARSWVKGEPIRYVTGHGRRKSGLDYVEIDMGYATPCWQWQRAKSRGYGMSWDPVHHRVRQAHIIYFERTKGDVPDGLELDHLCRNRDCVNPDHLEPVTSAVNNRRNRWTRLSDEKVRGIKAMLATGEFTQEEIARRFSVSRTTVTAINRGQNWSDVN